MRVSSPRTSSGVALAIFLVGVGCSGNGGLVASGDGGRVGDAAPDSIIASAEGGMGGGSGDAGREGSLEGGADASFDASSDAAPGAPRLLAPHSTGIVTSRQPTLRWTAAAGASSYLVQLCADAPCATVLQTVTSSGTSASPPSALPPRKAVFWRVLAQSGASSTTSATWEFFVGARTAAKDTSWLGPPDFDRNGLTDVGLGSAANQAYVMLNQPGTDLPAATPSLTLTGSNEFGRATANAGDVNGDGFGDFVVGAFGQPLGGSGAASVFLGNVSGVSNLPILITGTSSMYALTVGGAGDVNGDGYADVLVSDASYSYLYLGGGSGVSTTPFGPTLNGSSGNSAGDVNGDGFADVIVCSASAKSATLYHGGAGGLTAAVQLAAPAGETTFGEACITAGDVNGDGYADVVVTTQGAASAYVFYGSPSGVQQAGASRLPGGGSGGAFGVTTAVASAGDVNGDGYADVILGAYNGNTVYVYQGGPTGIATSATTTFSGLPAGQYANSVAAAGDVNGDGYGDVVFAPSQCSGFDVYVYPGSAGGVTTGAPLRSWPTPSGSQCFGIVVR